LMCFEAGVAPEPRANCAESATPDLNLRRVAFPVTGHKRFCGLAWHIPLDARLNPPL
jgi:hypothetical protein